MTLHPRPDKDGNPVVIRNPDTPTPLASWEAADQIATIVPDGLMPRILNGIPVEPWRDAPTDRSAWAEVSGRADIDEPPFDAKGKGTGKHPAAGVVVVETDGL